MGVNKWSIYVRTAVDEQLMKLRLEIPSSYVRFATTSSRASDQNLDTDNYLQRMGFLACYRQVRLGPIM